MLNRFYRLMGIQGQEGLGRRGPTPIVGSTPTGGAPQGEGLARLGPPSVAQLDRAPASGLSRRGFLGTLVGGVAVATAARTFPFRVFSFPMEVKPATLGPVIAEYGDYLSFSEMAVIYYDKASIKLLSQELSLRAANTIRDLASPRFNLFRYQVVQ